MDGVRIRSRGMGMEGERRNGEIGGEVFEMLGVDRGMPGYLIREELQREKLEEQDDGQSSREDLKKDWRKVRGVYWLEDVGRK